MQSILRAWQDTFRGAWKPAIVGAVGFAFTFVLVARASGWATAVGEAQLWVFSAIGSVAAMALLFLYNLACAPYRIERDRRLKAEDALGKAVSSLRDAEQRKPILIIDVEGLVFGGYAAEDKTKRLVLAIVSVTNVGTMPSIANKWRMSVRINDVEVSSERYHISTLQAQAMNGTVLRFLGENAIYNNRQVIPIGGEVRGHIVSFVSEESLAAGNNVEAILTCQDVLGKLVIGRSGHGYPTDYIPGTEPTGSKSSSPQ